LHDPVSGVEIAPGKLTALVSARPSEPVAVLDRLGGFTASEATWGGVRLRDIDPVRLRERILVADNEADLFAGTLRSVVAGRLDAPDEDVWGSTRQLDEDVRGRTRPLDEDARIRTRPLDEDVARAIHAAMADDIVQALPDGLGSAVAAQGRNLSGGQRQRRPGDPPGRRAHLGPGRPHGVDGGGTAARGSRRPDHGRRHHLAAPPGSRGPRALPGGRRGGGLGLPPRPATRPTRLPRAGLARHR
jgi:hypothetical protein